MKHKPPIATPPPPPAVPRPEPPGAATVPIWLFGLLGAGLLAAAWYLYQTAGEFSPQVYAPYRTLAELRQANPKPAADPALATGALLYVKTCSPCHQNTGLGQPPMYPPLAGSDWVNAPGPDRLVRIVLHGLHGPITVKDATFNNIMVPWKDFLKDEEIAALLTYLRRNQSWGNAAPAVTPARVTAIRQAETTRDGPWTAEELLKIPADKP